MLNRLWRLVTDRLNYLTPTIKPFGYGGSGRDGQRRRLYDHPMTPLDRLLAAGVLTSPTIRAARLSRQPQPPPRSRARSPTCRAGCSSRPRKRPNSSTSPASPPHYPTSAKASGPKPPSEPFSVLVTGFSWVVLERGLASEAPVAGGWPRALPTDMSEEPNLRGHSLSDAWTRFRGHLDLMHQARANDSVGWGLTPAALFRFSVSHPKACLRREATSTRQGEQGWPDWFRSTFAWPKTWTGKVRRFIPASGSPRSTARSWSDDSTSTAMARVTLPGMVVNSAP